MTMFRKELQADGDSFKIRITRKEAELHDWELKCVLDISDIVKIRAGKKNKVLPPLLKQEFKGSRKEDDMQTTEYS